MMHEVMNTNSTLAVFVGSAIWKRKPIADSEVVIKIKDHAKLSLPHWQLNDADWRGAA